MQLQNKAPYTPTTYGIQHSGNQQQKNEGPERLLSRKRPPNRGVARAPELGSAMQRMVAFGILPWTSGQPCHWRLVTGGWVKLVLFTTGLSVAVEHFRVHNCWSLCECYRLFMGRPSRTKAGTELPCPYVVLTSASEVLCHVLIDLYDSHLKSGLSKI